MGTNLVVDSAADLDVAITVRTPRIRLRDDRPAGRARRLRDPSEVR